MTWRSRLYQLVHHGLSRSFFSYDCWYRLFLLNHRRLDAIHSLTDLFSDFATWLVLTLAKKPADADHPYMDVFPLDPVAMVTAVMRSQDPY